MFSAWYIYNGNSSVGFGGTTTTELMEKAKHYVDYYLDLYPNVGKLEVTKACPKCEGSGGRPNKRNRYATIPCKQCKGTGNAPMTADEIQQTTLTL